MGTIKIGSSSNKKGITVNPTAILFNNKNVKKIISGTNTIWEYAVALIPVMISNSMDGITISASSSGSNLKPFYAFDNNYSTYWHPTSNTKNNYIKITFPNGKIVNKMSISFTKSGSVSSRAFILQGSNDDLIWDDLKTITVSDFSSEIVENITNVKSYTNYRLFSSDALWVSGSYSCSVKEMQLYGR